jgi:hypothetical protein
MVEGTRAFSSALTYALSFTMAETVATETLAVRATSSMFAIQRVECNTSARARSKRFTVRGCGRP